MLASWNCLGHWFRGYKIESGGTCRVPLQCPVLVVQTRDSTSIRFPYLLRQSFPLLVAPSRAEFCLLPLHSSQVPGYIISAVEPPTVEECGWATHQCMGCCGSIECLNHRCRYRGVTSDHGGPALVTSIDRPAPSPKSKQSPVHSCCFDTFAGNYPSAF